MTELLQLARSVGLGDLAARVPSWLRDLEPHQAAPVEPPADLAPHLKALTRWPRFGVDPVSVGTVLRWLKGRPAEAALLAYDVLGAYLTGEEDEIFLSLLRTRMAGRKDDLAETVAFVESAGDEAERLAHAMLHARLHSLAERYGLALLRAGRRDAGLSVLAEVAFHDADPEARFAATSAGLAKGETSGWAGYVRLRHVGNETLEREGLVALKAEKLPEPASAQARQMVAAAAAISARRFFQAGLYANLAAIVEAQPYYSFGHETLVMASLAAGEPNATVEQRFDVAAGNHGVSARMMAAVWRLTPTRDPALATGMARRVLGDLALQPQNPEAWRGLIPIIAQPHAQDDLHAIIDGRIAAQRQAK